MAKVMLVCAVPLVLVWLAATVFLVAAGREEGKGGGVEAVVIAMERGALNRSDRGDPGGFFEISDPEVTYFDPFLEQPIRGLEALREYSREFYKGFPKDDVCSGEMTNVKVQVVGDVAVLTFNYTTKLEKSGRVNRWNTTEVYWKTKHGWRIIHTHWSFLKPALAK